MRTQRENPPKQNNKTEKSKQTAQIFVTKTQLVRFFQVNNYFTVYQMLLGLQPETTILPFIGELPSNTNTKL